MNSPWGRFTARGDAEVEARIATMMDSVAGALSRTLEPADYRSIVLIGGYGRGEGGVETRKGRQWPHNNFDFLIIQRSGAAKDCKERVDHALAPLAERFELGLDTGIVSEQRLRHSPCLVMWYDMRFGHKPVLGDPQFVPSLRRFRASRILPADARNLLVNRGTLLLINDLLLARGELSSADRRTIVKHAIKAIIGYGDTLLFFLDRYHWSYLEKQRRMRERIDVPTSFRRLYDEAMEFRFEPRYDPYVERDLAAWNDELRGILAPIHLQVESRRLDHDISWSNYPACAFQHLLMAQPFDPRAFARKVLHFIRGEFPRQELPALAHIGFRAGGMRELLSTLFPVVAYRLPVPTFRSLAASSLGAQGTDDASLRVAYLRAWGMDGDTNFTAVLRKHNLVLEASP